MKSLVSIIVPCYKQAQYLDEALQSVLAQNYTLWECIIINDGSPDNTEEVAKKWIEKDERFNYLYQENAGVSSARNFGITNARGEFLLPLDADDKISPDYVELAIQSFQEDTSLKVVYCKAEKFGDEVGTWDLPKFSLYNLSRNNLIFCSALYKKKDWESVGGYDVKMVFGWEDWEFWISILKNGGGVRQIDKVGFYYRVNEKSREKNLISTQMKSLLEYLSIKHADFFVKHFGSFTLLNHTIINTKSEYEMKLKSEKFVIDVFCKRFFGFSVFGNYK